MRVTSTSVSDLRATVVAPKSLAFRPIHSLLGFELRDHVVQRVEAGVPALVVIGDPAGLLGQALGAEPAGPHSADLLGYDQPGALEHADMLLHAGQGHVETLGEIGDRRLGARQLVEHAAPGSVRQCGEGSIEAGGSGILNHMVQY
ncbi:conserved hypothetical protein [Ricinus communis]|uniref:Uncharacterized protein n=1 Tax=Ricinus communis TaxID=3988 RepID=B9TQ56_RICCO|nr:conserved hypothetical protein [Ricinus communis]